MVPNTGELQTGRSVRGGSVRVNLRLQTDERSKISLEGDVRLWPVLSPFLGLSLSLVLCSLACTHQRLSRPRRLWPPHPWHGACPSRSTGSPPPEPREAPLAQTSAPGNPARRLYFTHKKEFTRREMKSGKEASGVNRPLCGDCKQHSLFPPAGSLSEGTLQVCTPSMTWTQNGLSLSDPRERGHDRPLPSRPFCVIFLRGAAGGKQAFLPYGIRLLPALGLSPNHLPHRSLHSSHLYPLDKPEPQALPLPGIFSPGNLDQDPSYSTLSFIALRGG